MHLSVNIFANAVSVGPAAEAVTFPAGRSIVFHRTEYCFPSDGVLFITRWSTVLRRTEYCKKNG